MYIFLYVTRSHAFPLSINVKIKEDAISKHLNHFETYSLTQNVCHVIEHQVELQGLLKTSLYIRADLISDCSVNAMKLGICCPIIITVLGSMKFWSLENLLLSIYNGSAIKK